jgi:hypothetical protein
VALPVLEAATGSAPLPALAEHEPVVVRTAPAQLSMGARVLPAIGSALVWAGREITPRLVDLVLERLERRFAQRPAGEVVGREPVSGRSRANGHQRRRRQRHRSGRA